MVVKEAINPGGKRALQTERMKLEEVGNHDNIVKLLAVVDSEEEDANQYPARALVLEFVDGGDLNFIISRYPRGMRWFMRGLPLLNQVASALVYLHNSTQLQHRDLDPSNLLIDESLRCCKLTDLGFATKSSNTSQQQTAVGKACASIPSMCHAL